MTTPNTQPQLQGQGENPFEPQSSHMKSGIIKGAATVGAAAVGVGAIRLGVDLDSELVIRPPAMPWLTDGIIEINNAVRKVGVPITAAAVALQAGYFIKSKVNETAESRYDLASSELSGLESITDESDSWYAQNKRRLKGLGLATLAGVFVASSTSIEHEVGNGPKRTVIEAGDLLGEGDERPVYVAQHDKVHFMDESLVHATTVEAIKKEAANYDDVTVVEFDKGLPRVFLPGGETTDGIILAIPDVLSTSEESANSPNLIPVVVDESLGLEPAGILDIDQSDAIQLVVAGEEEGASSMNRTAIVMDLDRYTEDIEGGKPGDANYFGVAVSGADKELVEQIVKSAGVEEETGVLTEDEFIENNRIFWQQNGTAILLQQMAYLGSFAGVAIGSARRNKLLQNIQEVGMLMATGTNQKVLTGIEALRATRNTTRSMLLASAGAIPAFAGALNATVRGLEVGTSLRSIAAAYSVMLGAQVIPSVRAIPKFTKNISIARMLRR